MRPHRSTFAGGLGKLAAKHHADQFKTDAWPTVI
jgi:hypothetical protein